MYYFAVAFAGLLRHMHTLPDAGSLNGVTPYVLICPLDKCINIRNAQAHQAGANGMNVKQLKAALGNGRPTDHDVSPNVSPAEAAEPGRPFGLVQLSVTAGASTDKQEVQALGEEVPRICRAHRASHPRAELVLRWTPHRAGLWALSLRAKSGLPCPAFKAWEAMSNPSTSPVNCGTLRCQRSYHRISLVCSGRFRCRLGLTADLKSVTLGASTYPRFQINFLSISFTISRYNSRRMMWTG